MLLGTRGVGHSPGDGGRGTSCLVCSRADRCGVNAARATASVREQRGRSRSRVVPSSAGSQPGSRVASAARRCCGAELVHKEHLTLLHILGYCLAASERTAGRRSVAPAEQDAPKQGTVSLDVPACGTIAIYLPRFSPYTERVKPAAGRAGGVATASACASSRPCWLPNGPRSWWSKSGPGRPRSLRTGPSKRPNVPVPRPRSSGMRLLPVSASDGARGSCWKRWSGFARSAGSAPSGKVSLARRSRRGRTVLTLKGVAQS